MRPAAADTGDRLKGGKDCLCALQRGGICCEEPLQPVIPLLVQPDLDAVPASGIRLAQQVARGSAAGC